RTAAREAAPPPWGDLGPDRHGTVDEERRRAARGSLDRRHVGAEPFVDRTVAEAGLQHQRVERLVHPAVVVHDVNQPVRVALVPRNAYLILRNHYVSGPPAAHSLIAFAPAG